MRGLFIALACGYCLTLAARDNETLSVYQKYPNRIYLGPEVFWFDVDTHVQGVHVHDGKFFAGLQLGYEHLAPYAFYVGVELLAAGSNKSFRATYQGHHFARDHGLTGWGNIALRLGYTFLSRHVLLTPFLGLGGYTFGNGNHHFGFKESMAYASAGVRLQYPATTAFSVGGNLEVLRTMDTEKRFKHSFGQDRISRSEHRNMWGVELGIPFIWRVGVSKRWDVQLEPYFLKLGFSGAQNAYGVRLLLGYRL
jgi:hypothetical protein